MKHLKNDPHEISDLMREYDTATTQRKSEIEELIIEAFRPLISNIAIAATKNLPTAEFDDAVAEIHRIMLEYIKGHDVEYAAGFTHNINQLLKWKKYNIFNQQKRYVKYVVPVQLEYVEHETYSKNEEFVSDFKDTVEYIKKQLPLNLREVWDGMSNGKRCSDMCGGGNGEQYEPAEYIRIRRKMKKIRQFIIKNKLLDDWRYLI